MTDTPSHLQLSLRWTLPGAALLSLPLGVWLQPQIMNLFGLNFRIPGSELQALIGLLILICPFTSVTALKHAFREKFGWSVGCVAFFNFIVLLAIVAILVLPWVIALQGGSGLDLD